MNENFSSFDLRAEKIIIGCSLLRPESLTEAFKHGLIVSRMSPANGEVIRQMLECGSELSLPVLCMRLSKAGMLEQSGGAGNLSSCMDGIAGAISEVSAAVEAINDKYERRQLLMMGQSMIDRASDRMESPDSILRQLREKAIELSISRPGDLKLLIPAPEFSSLRKPDIDWLVRGVIERGSNGFIAGPPKAGKSWISTDLAICLATGQRWLGLEVAYASKVALISREDNPAMTAWRLKALCFGRSMMPENLSNLWINSKEQSPRFRIDDPALLSPMIARIKDLGSEVIILDVMNILHSADENDASQMRSVMDALTFLHTETGAGVCVVHHFNKSGDGSLTQRLRGSSAIAGWAEYVVAVDRKADGPRTVRFESKSAASPEPIQFWVESEGQIAFVKFDGLRNETGQRLRM